LVAARSDVCTFIQFRENNRYDDPPLKSIKLEPGKPVPMRPTATHLRLVGMRQPLKLGDRFKIILDFLNSGEFEIEVFVEEKPGD
jgi:copper(I)-binding protein